MIMHLRMNWWFVLVCCWCANWPSLASAQQQHALAWASPQEGAVIDGTAPLKIRHLDNRDVGRISYFLQANVTADYDHFEQQYHARRRAQNDADRCNDDQGYLSTTCTHLQQLLPDLLVADTPLTFPPLRLEIDGYSVADEQHPKDDEFVPKPVDFSCVLPGRYRLIAEYHEDDNIRQVVCHIEIRSKAKAPVINVNPIDTLHLTPRGELRLSGNVTNLDAQHERDIYGRLDEYHQVLSDQMTTSIEVVFAIDGRFAGGTHFPDRETRTSPADFKPVREWKGVIPLFDHADTNDLPPGLAPGSHRLTVITKDKFGNGGAITCTFQLPLTFLDLLARQGETPTTEFERNTPIILHATPVGGNTLDYAFFMADGKEWRMLRDFAPKDTYTWTPAVAGNYRMKCVAKEHDGSRTRTVVESLTIANPLTRLQLSVSPSTVMPVWTSATVTAHVDGGLRVLYTFLFFDGKEWIPLREKSPANSQRVVPIRPGPCQVKVFAVDVHTGRSVSASLSMTGGAPVPLRAVNVKFESNSVWAEHVGGSSAVSFRFSLSHDGKHWTALPSVSGARGSAYAECDFSGDSGLLYARVRAHDAQTGKDVVGEAISRPMVIKPFTGGHLTTDRPSPQPLNTCVTIQYQTFNDVGLVDGQLFINDGAGWQLIDKGQVYGTWSFRWRPTTPGTYRFRMVASYDASSHKEFRDEMTYTITE